MTLDGPRLAATAGAVSLAFALLWWRQTRTANATSVDAAWAVAIGILGIGSAALGGGSVLQRGIALAVAAMWSGRLSWHLLRHRVFAAAHRAEDGRYRAMRAHFGARANFNFFWFYQLQAAAALAFAAPFWLLADDPSTSLAPIQWAGFALFVASQWTEALADRQLQAHRLDPEQRSRTCRRGLWRYSRHPNYFFEWLSWCGIGLLAAPAAGWLAAIQPALMFVLVRFVSGVPFTELQAIRGRGEDYRRYQLETNAFVPWWPRRGDGLDA